MPVGTPDAVLVLRVISPPDATISTTDSRAIGQTDQRHRKLVLKTTNEEPIEVTVTRGEYGFAGKKETNAERQP